MEEVLLQGRWLKEIGNAQNVEQKSTNFLSNQPRTDQSIAENAGKKRDLQNFQDSSLF